MDSKPELKRSKDLSCLVSQSKGETLRYQTTDDFTDSYGTDTRNLHVASVQLSSRIVHCCSFGSFASSIHVDEFGQGF